MDNDSPNNKTNNFHVCCIQFVSEEGFLQIFCFAQGSGPSSIVSEEEQRPGLSAARIGLPLATHILPGGAPCFFPALPSEWCGF